MWKEKKTWKMKEKMPISGLTEDSVHRNLMQPQLWPPPQYKAYEDIFCWIYFQFLHRIM